MAAQQLTSDVMSSQSSQVRGRDQRQRGQSKEQQRVAKLVFKKRDRDRSHDQDMTSLASVKGAANPSSMASGGERGGVWNQKKVD